VAATTVADGALTPNTVTRTNNPSTGWVSPYQTDGYWGNQFNGTNAYLTVASNSGLAFGTNNFTIEFWAYLNTVSATQIFYSSQTSGSYTVAPDIYLYNGKLYVQVSSANPINGTGPTTLVANRWYHIALVKSSGTTTLYVNGTFEASYSDSYTYVIGANRPVIGVYGYNPTVYYLNGYLSNLRVVNGTAIVPPAGGPTSPLTPVPNTSLLTCQSNRFLDTNTQLTPKVITPSGTPQVTPYFYPSGFTAPAASPGAGLFAAASSQTLITTQTQVIPTGNFTIEVWAYVTSSTATQVFVSQGTSGSAGRTAIGIDNSSGAKWFCQVGGVFVYSSAAPVLNTWNYLAMTYNGATIALYLNGTLLNSASNTTSAQNSQLRVSGLWTPATAGYYLDGYLSNIRVSNTVRTVTSVPTTFLTSDANTTLLLNLADSNYNSATNGVQNNTFIDESNYAFPITRNGTPTQGSITPYWPNGQWSNYFNGTTDYLAAPNSAFSLGSNDFTIEGWFYLTQYNSIGFYLNGGSGTAYAAIRFELASATSQNLYISQTGSSWANTTTFTNNIPLNSWVHIAITRSGNSIKYYFNGAFVSPTITLTGALYAGPLNWIGAFSFSGVSGFYAGYASNIRVVNGTCVYTANFTPPTTPLTAITNTALLTCQSNRFRDNSTNNFTITPNGTPRVQAFQPFSPAASYSAATYAGSGYFNGSTDYLTTPANAAFTFGTGDLTLECWIYQTATSTSAYKVIFTDNVYAAAGGYALYSYNNALNLWRGGAEIIAPAGTINLNTWTHVAWTRSGSSNRLFINGTQVGATTTNANSYTGTITYIGASSVPTLFFPGYISNARIVKGTAVYTANFTPPTTPVTNIAQTSLLLNMANAGIYDAAVQNNMITVGNAQVSTAQSKWSPSSMAFDGSGDYLRILPVLPSLTLGTSNFTIDGWVYFNTVAGAQTIFDQRPAGTNGAYPVLYMNGATMVWYVNTAGQITSGSLATGVWYYFAVTRSSSVTRMYINGSQVGSNYSDTNNYLASGTLIGITSDIASGLNGYLQDFRITRGVARTITTPTAAFPTR
jgi:hypothetical protein